MVRGSFFIVARVLGLPVAFYDFLALGFSPPIVGLSAFIRAETAKG